MPRLKQFLFNLFICFTALINSMHAGVVHYEDLAVDLPLLGLAKTISITFHLDTALPTTGSMLITMPFLSSGTTTASFYTTSTYGCTSLATPPSTTTSATIQSTTAGLYWVQFSTSLVASTTYTLLINYSSAIDVTIYDETNSIAARPVSMDTYADLSVTSAAQLHKIDTNPVFANFWISNASVPSLSTVLAASGATSSQDTTSTIQLTITPSTSLVGRLLIQLTSTAAYAFDYSTPSTFCTATQAGVALVYGTDFTCSINNSQQVNVNFASSLTSAVVYVVSIKLYFPPYSGTATLKVVALTHGENIIKEVSSVISGISTIDPQWTGLALYGFLGKELQTSGSSTDIFCIYRNPSSSTLLFNQLKFELKVSTSLVSSQAYKLTLSLGSTSTVLVNSISTINFAIASGSTEILCTTPTSIYLIECVNIGAMVAGTSYYITLRVSIPYQSSSVLEPTLDSDFGTVQIYTLLSSSSATTYTSTPTVISQTASNLLTFQTGRCLKNSANFAPSSYPGTTEPQMVHSRSNAVSVDTDITSSEVFGVKADSTTAQAIQFYVDFTSSNFGTVTSTSGFEFYANSNLFQADSTLPACPLKSALGLSTSVCTVSTVLTDAVNPVASTGSTAAFTVFKSSFSSSTDTTTYLSASSSSKVLTFTNIIVLRPSSLVPTDAYSSDFFLSTIESESPTIYGKSGMVNSYVIPATLLNSISLNLVNFWTGTSNNDGSLIPTFIRINILFSSSNTFVLTDAKWVLFFDNVNFLGSISDSTSPSCTNTQNSISANCRSYSGLSTSTFFQFKNWITFHTQTTSAMTILNNSITFMLPVSTIATLTTVQMRLALVNPSSSDLVLGVSAVSYFTQPALSYATSLSSFNLLNYLTIMDYKVRLQSTALSVGASPVTVPLSIAAADTSSTFIVGTSSVQAAGFTLASVHDFASNSLFNIVGTSLGITATQPHIQCTKFSYQQSSTNRYGIFCPLYTSPMNIQDLTVTMNYASLPWQLGATIPEVYAGLSGMQSGSFSGDYKAMGILLKYSRDKTENAMSPNTLTSVGVDIDLPLAQSFIKAMFTFTTSFTLTNNFNLVLTESTSSRFYFTVNQAVECTFWNQNLPSGPATLIAVTSCSQYFRNGTQAILEVRTSGTSGISAGSYAIKAGGIDIVNDPKMRQFVTVQTETPSGSISGQSSSALQVTFNLNPGEVSLQISNLNFLVPNKRAMTVFRFTITVTGRAIYSDEYIEINMNAFSIDNTYQSALCKIEDSAGAISPLWSKCYFDGSFSQLKMYPYADIVTYDSSNQIVPAVFTVQISQIRVPRTPVEEYYMSAGLYNSKDSSQVILQHQSVTLPTRSSEKLIRKYSQIMFQKKLFLQVGSLVEFAFSVKPLVADLDTDSMILFYLTGNYAPQNALVEPVCYTQAIPSSSAVKVFNRCEFISDHVIAVRDLYPTFTKDVAYNLFISGIAQPYTAAYDMSLAMILIQKYDSISTSVLEYIEFPDVSPTTTLPALGSITGFSTTSTYIIETSDYYFGITLPTTTSAGSYLVLEFSSDWVDKNQNKATITCSIITTSTLAATCVQEGYRVTVTVPSTLPTSFELILYGFNNPHNANCIRQRINLSAVSSTKVSVLSRSRVGSVNISARQFGGSTSSSNIFSWSVVSNDFLTGAKTITALSNPIQIYRGSYSHTLRMSVSNGSRFSRNFQMTLQLDSDGLSTFTVSPTSLSAYLGGYSLDLRLGCARAVAAGLYSVYFDLTNGGSYNQPPVIKVLVTTDPYSIPNPVVSTISVSKFGFSLPILWNLDAAVPLPAVKIETDIDILPDLALDYLNYSDMSFSISNQFDSIRLMSDEQPLVSSTTSALEIYTADDNLDYFTLGISTLAITLIATPSTAPTLTMAAGTLTATQAQFSLSSTQLTIVYYQIQLSTSSLSFSFSSIYEKVRQKSAYDFDDVNQAQYGMIPLYQVSTVTALTVQNLFSNRQYTIKFFPQNLAETTGSTVSYTFTAADNSDTFIKTKIVTKAILTPNAYAYIACLHANLFSYPVKRIRSIYENYCDPSVTAASIAASPPSVSTVSMTYSFYLYPFEYQEVVSQVGVQSNVNDLRSSIFTTILPYFNSGFTSAGISAIESLTYEGIVAIHAPVFSSLGTLTTTSTTILLSGISLTYNGIIFAIVEQLSISIKGRVMYVTDPTFLQVRNGLNSTGLTAIASGAVVYESTPVSLYFENLAPSAHYRIVLWATSEDPSQYKLITSKLSAVETTLPASASHLATSLFVLLLAYLLM